MGQGSDSPQGAAAHGTAIFLLVWFGQLISYLGSGLTSFVLGVWVYQRTGSATRFALVSTCAVLPSVVISPLAGALIDRWDRRRAMLMSDTGSALGTLAIVILLWTGRLEVWHVYLAVAVGATFYAFQWPAYAATITLLVPKQHLGRANGLLQFADAAAQVVSPALGGLLLVALSLRGVMLIDFATFLFALVTLLAVRFPQPRPAVAEETGRGSLLREALYGWTYITSRPGLFGLLVFIAASNFLAGIVTVLATPFVLSFAPVTVLGLVLSVGGCGMLAGGIVMSLWGGPKRRIHGVLGFELLRGLGFILAGLRPSTYLLAVAAFFIFFGLPITTGSSLAIWQSKVAPGVQGRVFAARRMIAWSSLPFAYLIAGPLADYVFEPLLAVGGPLTGSLGQVIGAGPGRGIGLLFILIGVLTILIAVAGYMYPRIRLVEDELPDIVAGEAMA
nr:major facilitator transporter [uncultured bacterium]